jgi:hypothetical protein
MRSDANKNLPLIKFDALYYSYPTSVSRGYWGCYPIEADLSNENKNRRKEWLEKIKRDFYSEFYKKIIKRFYDHSDIELLLTLQNSHGIFAERFFNKEIRSRIINNFVQLNIELQTFQKLLSDMHGYKYHAYNKFEAISYITSCIYEDLLFKTIHDHKSYHQLNEWFEKFKLFKQCALCGNKFRVIDLPDWIYFGSNGYTSCCFQCKIIEKPRKSELAKLIPEFVDYCGFIPSSSVNPINYSFTSRLSEANWARTIIAYGKIGGIDHVKKKFNTWFEALVKTKALPNGVLATKRGIRCIAKDGHECHSLDEQRIDNWLFVHNLSHEREPYYPFHSSFNPKGNRRADWKVGDTFIEYFGLIGDKNYERKMDEKILLAAYSKLKLVSILPSDVEKLDSCLKSLL